MNNNKNIIECQNLSKNFGEGENQISILHNLNLAVTANQSIAINGVSGSGKSTLLHILGGLDFASKGEVFINGQMLSKASEKEINYWRANLFGFIYQFHFLIAELSALENVALPLMIRGENKELAQKKAQSILVNVGLRERLIHRPGELSGGERQRVAVARALVGNPQCIFADEPTGSLDNENALVIWQLLNSLCKESRTSLILVTHDSRLAHECDIKYKLINGSLEKV